MGRINGRFTETGRECQLAGRFVAVDYTGSQPEEGSASLVKLAAKARIRFATDETVYTVGGRGAHIEDVAGKRFTIDRIGAEDDPPTS